MLKSTRKKMGKKIPEPVVEIVKEPTLKERITDNVGFFFLTFVGLWFNFCYSWEAEPYDKKHEFGKSKRTKKVKFTSVKTTVAIDFDSV